MVETESMGDHFSLRMSDGGFQGVSAASEWQAKKTDRGRCYREDLRWGLQGSNLRSAEAISDRAGRTNESKSSRTEQSAPCKDTPSEISS